MQMTKEEFREKIEAGESIIYGRYSCRKEGRDYCFYSESAEIFQSFDKLWERVHSFILYSVNRSKLDGPPALDFDPLKFNNMGGYEESVIPNYYERGQDLVIWYNPFPKIVTVDQLATRHKRKEGD